MNKLIKIFILIVALVLPVFIYLFLRGFGENQFVIPVYYTDGVSIEGCPNESNKQHLVEFESYPLEGVHLFYFPQWVNNDEFYSQSVRIHEKWPNVQFTAIADSSNEVSKLGNLLRVDSEAQLYNIANCSLVLGQDTAISAPLFNHLVLVDAQKRIRGYYIGSDLDDMDRLDIEIDILSREKK